MLGGPQSRFGSDGEEKILLGNLNTKLHTNSFNTFGSETCEQRDWRWPAYHHPPFRTTLYRATQLKWKIVCVHSYIHTHTHTHTHTHVSMWISTTVSLNNLPHGSNRTCSLYKHTSGYQLGPDRNTRKEQRTIYALWLPFYIRG